ncbi:MAG TPA: hypothetical protein VKE94_08540 [Gemmataceae bacterium]|nr:hypothetical protein [Gemmataceae bacterium]
MHANLREAWKESRAAFVKQFLPSTQVEKEQRAREEQRMEDYLKIGDEVLAEVQAKRAQPTEAQ